MSETQILHLLGYGSMGLLCIAAVSLPLLLIWERQLFRVLLIVNCIICFFLSICGSYTLYRMSQHYDHVQSARLVLILALHGLGEDGTVATDEYTTRFFEEMKALVRDRQNYTIEPASSGNFYFDRKFIFDVRFPAKNVYYTVRVTYPLGYRAYGIDVDHSSLLGPPSGKNSPTQGTRPNGTPEHQPTILTVVCAAHPPTDQS